jgi:hypothetical protein
VEALHEEGTTSDVSRLQSSRRRTSTVNRSALISVRRSVRQAVSRPWKDTGVEPIDIGRLVSPLRYDVMTRVDFFRFLDTNLDLYRRNFTRFSKLAREEPYFAWFERVALPRFRPRLARKDRALVLHHYDERLHRSHALWMSFLKVGLDPRYPVTLRRAHPGARTENGLQIDRLYHLGDGCHRLAMLLVSGERLLPPDVYRIDRRPQRVILDNTAVLVPALDLDEERYAGFLSLHYADRQHSDLHSLSRDVRDQRPTQLNELCSVIRHHRLPEWQGADNDTPEQHS